MLNKATNTAYSVLVTAYESVDPYPIDFSTAAALNYPDILNISNQLFMQFHRLEWGKLVALTPRFTLHKVKENLLGYINGVWLFRLMQFFDYICTLVTLNDAGFKCINGKN
ncbi:MAG: hypothetical protein LBL94_10750 [Prevotellaceae bacterium]|jgi:hypothetical protein|nr:hypothetical protein [Prevotellaceae bacterium]